MTAALLLVALASHVVPPRYGRDRPSHYVPPGSSRLTTLTPPPRAKGRPGMSHPPPLTIPAYILLGLLVAALVWRLAVVLLARRRPSLRKRRAARGSAGLAAAQLARRIETAVDEGLDELAHGAVTDAIIACWLRLEDAAASAGAAPRPTDTPTETVVRVLGQGRARPAPLETLAELYREARFSRHVMTESSRAAARTALEDIRADLARRDDPAPATAPSTTAPSTTASSTGTGTSRA